MGDGLQLRSPFDAEVFGGGHNLLSMNKFLGIISVCCMPKEWLMKHVQMQKATGGVGSPK